jgi:hypothetical protein
MEKILVKNPSPHGEGFLFDYSFVNEGFVGVRLLVLLILCLLSLSSPAQKPFVIYSVVGNVSVQTTAGSKKAGSGEWLPHQSKISIGDGGGITVICERGSMISIEKPGVYVTDEIHIDCDDKPVTGITTNFGLYFRKATEDLNDRMRSSKLKDKSEKLSVSLRRELFISGAVLTGDCYIWG